MPRYPCTSSSTNNSNCIGGSGSITCTIRDTYLAADYLVDSTGSKFAVVSSVDHDRRVVTAVVSDTDPLEGRKFTVSRKITESIGQSTTVSYEEIFDLNGQTPRTAWSDDDYTIEVINLNKVTGESVSVDETHLVGEILVLTSDSRVAGTMMVKSRNPSSHSVVAVATRYANGSANESVLRFNGFISLEDPRNSSITVSSGDLWKVSSEDTPSTVYPWTNLKKWNGNSWESYPNGYLPSPFDVWSIVRIDRSSSYYYIGGQWIQLEFIGSTFDQKYFTIVDGLVSMRKLSIANDLISESAAIDQSKLDLEIASEITSEGSGLVISRTLFESQASQDEKIDKVNNSLESLVTDHVTRSEYEALEKRIKDLEDNGTVGDGIPTKIAFESLDKINREVI